MIIRDHVSYEDVISVSMEHESPMFRQPTKSMVENSTVFSVYEKGEYLAYIIFSKEYGDGIWSIPALATRKGYEGRGIMKKLMMEAIMRLKPKKIWLEVHPDNKSARNLYNYFGFNEIENPNVQYSDGKNIILCEVTLENRR